MNLKDKVDRLKDQLLTALAMVEDLQVEMLRKEIAVAMEQPSQAADRDQLRRQWNKRILKEIAEDAAAGLLTPIEVGELTEIVIRNI